MLRRLQEVMMVVPVDADVNEAQDIAEENRKEWLQSRKTGSLWRLHFQHHDGDDDGEYPVTKSLHAALGHPSYSFFWFEGRPGRRLECAPRSSPSRSPSLVWSTKATPVPEDRRARSGSSALSFESLKDLIALLSRQFKERSYDTYMTPIVCAFCVGCNLANPAE